MTESEAKALVEWFKVRKGKTLKLNDNGIDCVVEALEKQIAKKPMESKFGLMGCPLCLEKVGQRVTKTLYEDLFQYCPTCGQKILWDIEV